jgi:hypothetical protein
MHSLAQTKSSQIKTARLLHRRDGSGGAVAPLGMVHSHQFFGARLNRFYPAMKEI